VDEGRDTGELTKRPPSTVTKLQANADQHLEKIEGVAPRGHDPSGSSYRARARKEGRATRTGPELGVGA
jgi:hypothetical protein